jgi:hypothetical protein
MDKANIRRSWGVFEKHRIGEIESVVLAIFGEGFREVS